MQGLPLLLRHPQALYVHLPFCAKQCPYCDFPTMGLNAAVEERYLEALAREAQARLPEGWRARTVFLGGGTPTELTTPGTARLVEILANHIAPGAEVTMEANPRTLLGRKLNVLQEGLGVNRLSLGAQSFQPALLEALGRFHRPSDVEAAVRLARDRGIASVSIDLIFAVPGQRLRELEADLDALLALEPDHVSTYCLTFEEGTPYESRRAAGELHPASELRQARYYQRVRQRLRAAGFQHYEISSFARPGHRCRHNRIYWRNLPYYGLGNGAASHLRGVRSTNHRDVLAYVQAIETGGGAAARAGEEALAPERKIRETAYLALRTSEGIVRERFRRDTGVDPEAFFADELKKLRQLGLVQDVSGRIRLSGRGVSLADAVAVEIL